MSRILLADIADRIKDVANDNSIIISTSYDRRYLFDFAQTFPAIWVVGQRQTPRDDGTRYTGRARQNKSAIVLVRPVVQKYADTDAEGDYRTSEVRLGDLEGIVESALYAWTPAGAQRPFVWSMTKDGDAYETVSSSDMFFETWVTANSPA